MARRENAIRKVGAVAEFAQDLRNFRVACGAPTYRKMEVEAGMKYSTLAAGVRGHTMPTWNLVEAYLRGLGIIDPEIVADWRRQWKRACQRAEQMPAQERLEPSAMPNPTRVKAYADLIVELQQLKVAAGNPPYRHFYFAPPAQGRRTASAIPASTVSNVFTGRHITRLELYTRIVRGLVGRVADLYGPPEPGDGTTWHDVGAWRLAWARAVAHHRLDRPADEHVRRPADAGELVVWLAADHPPIAAQLWATLPAARRDLVLQELPLEIATKMLAATHSDRP